MYKMIVMDMDGTLLNESQEISLENKKAIQEAIDMGIKVVLASGRSFEGLIPYNKELGLDKQGNYCVSCCGALTVDNKTHEELLSFPIDHMDLQQILEMVEEYDLDMSAYGREEIYVHTDHLFSRFDALANCSPLIQADFHNLPSDLKIYKVNLVNESKANQQDIIDYFPKLSLSNYAVREKSQFRPNFLDEPEHIPTHIEEEYTIVRALPFVSEILKKECNKSIGVDIIAKKYGIKPSEIICIGDSGNDLHMIQYAGLGVAMKNGFDFVKEAADVITLSNNNHGVAHIINEYILSQKV